MFLFLGSRAPISRFVPPGRFDRPEAWTGAVALSPLARAVRAIAGGRVAY